MQIKIKTTGGSAGGLRTSFPASSNSAASVPASSGSSSGMSSGWMNLLQSQRDYNNAWNSAQVQALNAFNSAEAQKQRDWQERMSNTAHQREVQDLLAAGLNPVLSALNGNGASTPTGAAASGSKATADDTLSSGLISLMGAMISANSAMSIAQMQIENQRYMAQAYPSNIYGVLNSVLHGLPGFSNSAEGYKGIGTTIGKNAKEWYGNGFKGYFNKWKSYFK